MKKILIFTILAIFGLVSASSVAAQDQKLTLKDLPVFVENCNSMCPSKSDDGSLILTKVQLINDGKQVDFVFEFYGNEYYSDEEFLEALKTCSKEEQKVMLGSDFEEMANCIPVPISIYYQFPNLGVSHRITY